jgi:uncharacterized phage protein (TIGR02218 family)
MRTIPADLAAELASGVTTLCRCWRVHRRDGVTFGFTDHDRDLVFSGLTYLARTGLEASEAVATLGFAVGGGEIGGALVADAITEGDIIAGLWDNALIDVWIVDWTHSARRMLFDSGHIGEISRSGQSFTAELRSLAHQFDQDQGRRYQALCSAELGDTKCGVDLSIMNRSILTSVQTLSDASTFAVSLVSALPSGSFVHGKAIFLPGLAGEVAFPIMSHTRMNNLDVISLWNPPSVALVQGSAVRLQMGCDKRFSTCRDRFFNAQNFRGFPHIPGNDFLLSYARQGDAELDGSVVVQ